MKKQAYYVIILCLAFIVIGCAKDDGYSPTDDDPIDQISPVNFDLELIPYQTLSEYNFFEDNLADLSPVYGVLPYELISPLFSDYSKKKRFIWMPDGSEAVYIDDNTELDFPVGTMIIKNFYYNNVVPGNSTRIIETRLLILKNEGWVFANYKWNETQTEAVFDLSGSFVNVDFNEGGENKSVNYKIPGESECFLCHQSEDGKPFPVGVKPQNLNKSFAYEDGVKNQLQKMIEMGYLKNNLPSSIESVVDYADASQPLELRVRSYLDINCAHCHSDFGHCSYRPMRFDFKDNSDPFNLGICVEAAEPLDENLTKIIEPGNADNSVIVARLKSNNEAIRMPLIGRSILHDEGVALIEEWINALENECN